MQWRWGSWFVRLPTDEKHKIRDHPLEEWCSSIQLRDLENLHQEAVKFLLWLVGASALYQATLCWFFLLFATHLYPPFCSWALNSDWKMRLHTSDQNESDLQGIRQGEEHPIRNNAAAPLFWKKPVEVVQASDWNTSYITSMWSWQMQKTMERFHIPLGLEKPQAIYWWSGHWQKAQAKHTGLSSKKKIVDHLAHNKTVIPFNCWICEVGTVGYHVSQINMKVNMICQCLASSYWRFKVTQLLPQCIIT